MDDRQKLILTLEKDASQLVDELGVLKKEVSSYRTATDELDKVRSVLAGFLEQTQKLTEQTHKLIETANAIGSAKILQQLESIQMAAAQNAKREAQGNRILIVAVVVMLVMQVVMLVMLKGTR